MITVFFYLLLFTRVIRADFSYMGCYANTGVSLGFKNTYLTSIVEQCSAICYDSKYIGLIEGNKCYCGESSPLSNSVSDANCNSNCTSPGGNCGGSSFYAVYSNNDMSSSSSSSSTSSDFSSTTDSSSLSSTLSSSATTTDSSSSGTLTISPSSSLAFASNTLVNSSTSSTFSSSSLISVLSNFSSTKTYSHSHKSASTHLSSDQTVITSNSEYVSDGVTITSAVLLTTRNGDVDITKTAENLVSSSVTVVNNKSANIRSQVAGGVVGAAAGVSLICFLVWYYTRRVKQKDEEEKQRNLATIAATMASRNPELSSHGTIHGNAQNPFQRSGGSLGTKPSTHRRLELDDSFNYFDNQSGNHLIRMGSTGRESTFVPMRMGSTGHDDDNVAHSHQDSFGQSTLGSFSSNASDGYYAEKLAMDAQEADLQRNASSSSQSTGKYSFNSFDSKRMIVDDEIASNVDRDDGSVHEYMGATSFGLTIANPDHDDSDDEDNNRTSQFREDGSKLRVLF